MDTQDILTVGIRKKMKKIAVIIPSFNTQFETLNIVKQCLSLVDSNLNIIVIENGSTDGTVTKLGALYLNNLYVKYNPKNEGYSKAINQGILLADKTDKPDYYVFLNTDTILLNKNIFDEMANILEKYQDFGCIIPHDAVIGNKPEKRIKWITEVVGFVNEGMWYCIMLSRKTIEKIGMLDEQFFLHCSDSDYQIRIDNAKMKVGVFKNNNMIKHIGFQASRRLPNIHELIAEDRERFNIKHNIKPNII